MRISTRLSAFLGLLIVLVSVTLLSMRSTGGHTAGGCRRGAEVVRD
jgi:hypothetical protein